MGQKIEIIKAEKFNWYKVGDILELAPEQKHVTLGVQVIAPEGAVGDIVIHGNYKDYVEVELDATTEELIFTIEIKSKNVELVELAPSVLSKCVLSCTEQIQNQTNLSFDWLYAEKQRLTSQGKREKLYIFQTIKDSHFHMNTTLWTQACIDIVCLLQQKMSEADIRAYSTPIRLYSFIQK